MGLPNLNFNELAGQNQFVQDTISQLNKDLHAFHEPVVWSGGADPLHALCEILAPILSKISSENRLNEFLYRVDLAETKYNTISSGQNYFYTLAGLIIEREALKVFLRSKFNP